MTPEKAGVIGADHVEPRVDAPVQRLLGFAHARRHGGVVRLNPPVHLGQRRVVVLHQLMQLLLRRVVRIRDGDRNAGLFLHQIADGERLVGGQQRAQKSDG